jgi:tRNA(Ile)-lysidine synthase
VHELAHKLLDHIRRHELLKPGDRAGVAVSGGVDSVGLLRLLLELRKELGVVLSVIHFNHKLRGSESDADEQFVADLARHHKLQLHLKCADVRTHASAERLSIETAARELRYEFFTELLGASESGADGSQPEQGNPPGRHSAQSAQSAPLDKIATGHTLDDQAETVLMRLLRGTGTSGLAGIYPRLVVEGSEEEKALRDEPGEIIRPLLGIRRRELERYLNALGQSWREDATNRDLKYTRNRVRHTLLPLLEREFNPGITGSLSDLAEIARAEEDYWENEASGWMGTTVQWFSADAEAAKPANDLVQLRPAGANALPDETGGSPSCGPQRLNASVDLMWLLAEPLAVQRRVVKSVGDEAEFPLEFKHVEEILRFAAEESNVGKQLVLPLGWRALREEDSLVFLSPTGDVGVDEPQDYEYRLPVPGQVQIPELDSTIQAVRAAPGESPAGYNREQALDAALLSDELTVRNWRPGDRFWPAHTKSPKKIKELLQGRYVTGRERKLWPVVTSRDEIVWVRGFPLADKFRAQAGCEAVVIRELAREL